MLKIAICDDDISTIKKLEELLLVYAKQNLIEMNIQYFSTPSKLYAHLEKESEDIVFMDLDFGEESEDGILWSIRIHQDFPQTLVMILTAYENRYKEGYVAKVFRFMTKPFSQEELSENIDACLEELSLYRVVTLSRHGTIQKIPILEILYFSAMQGGSEFKTIHTSYFCPESLAHWESTTSPSIFFRCSKKYLVNLNAIEKLSNQTILLCNGEKIPVSRRKWTLLKSAYMKFDIAMKGRAKISI